jgi:3-oxoacyl-[acyl-carrier protein] reductase
MLLKQKVAVVYGGAGAIGGAAARVFAREGATVYLVGRTRAKLEAVAADIAAAGDTARVAPVDVFNQTAVDRHAAAVLAEAGRLDVALNAIAVPHWHGIPLAELSLEEYESSIVGYTRAHFITARAVARHMVAQRSGVILTLSTPAARLAFPGVLGFGTACAAIEGFSRQLAGELGPHGVRVVCLRPDAIPEAVAAGSHSRDVFQRVAEGAGITVDRMLAEGAKMTLLKRLATLAEVANTAAFVASDHGGAITATTVNLSCGSVVD